MPSTQSIPAVNRLLGALPQKDFKHLLADCELVELSLAEELASPGDSIRHVYFPTDSVISVMMPLDGTAGNAGLEVALIGNEGLLGLTLMLGVEVAPFHAVVQGAGPALRIPAATFLRKLDQSPALQRLMKHYLFVSMSQLAQTAACTRFHVVEERLARWLLMAQDRAHSDTFRVTHLFLAGMLGVRRVGITKAATSLQKRELIRYYRGEVTILDRLGLEAASCECYRKEKEAYRRIMG